MILTYSHTRDTKLRGRSIGERIEYVFSNHSSHRPLVVLQVSEQLRNKNHCNCMKNLKGTRQERFTEDNSGFAIMEII